MNAFLRGEYTMDAEFQALVERGKKTQGQVDEMVQLANEVQYSVLTKGLVPGELLPLFHRTGHLPSRRTDLTCVRNSDAHVLQPHGLPAARRRARAHLARYGADDGA